MKLGTIPIALGVVLMIGGLAAGFITTAVQMGHAYTAVGSDAPPEVLAEYVHVAMYGTAIGLAVCVVGIGMLIAGLVMRAIGKRARSDGQDVSA